MALMIPPSYLAEYRSPGEEFVFSRLRDEAPDDWIVLHSLDIAPAERRRRGEADFVVIVPSLGIVVIEVKSIARQNEDYTWYFGKEASRVARSPFQQAETAMRSIMDYLDHSMQGRRPFLTSGVVTPFGDVRSARGKTIEWNEWQAIGESRIARYGLAGAIQGLLIRDRDICTNYPADFSAEAVKGVLRDRFEFYQSPSGRRRRMFEEVRTYTAEQFEVLDDYALNGQLLVDGRAGTGKTMLALEASRRAVEEGKRVLLLCYNRNLGDWLKCEARELAPRADTHSIHSLMMRLTERRDTGGEGFWDRELPEAALERIISGSLFQSYDTVIVDEAQDLLWPPYLDLISACLRGELHRGEWLFLGDLEKQDLFLRADKDDAVSILTTAVGARVFQTRLRKNCRNTLPVAQFACRVGGITDAAGYAQVLRTGQGHEPEIVHYANPSDQVPLLVDTLDDLREVGYGNDEIIVLSICSSHSSAMDALLFHTPRDVVGSWPDRIRPYKLGERGFVHYDTVRRFKGLERAVVIVTDVSILHDHDGLLADLLYVAATRTLDRLIVFADDSVGALVSD